MPRRRDTWDPLSVMLTIMLTGALGFGGWLFTEQIKDHAFRHVGDRFTATQARELEMRLGRREDERHHAPPAWLVNKLADLTQEQRRLQCQIDRLEGNDCILDGLKWHGVPSLHPRERVAGNG